MNYILALLLVLTTFVDSLPVTNQYMNFMNGTIIEEPLLKNGTNSYHEDNSAGTTAIIIVCILAPMIFGAMMFGFCRCKKCHIICCEKVSGYETI